MAAIKSTSDTGSVWPYIGAAEAFRASKLAQRSPTDDDRPPVSVLPGRKPKILRGQLDLDGDEVGGETYLGE